MVERLLDLGAKINDKVRIADNSKRYLGFRSVTPLERARMTGNTEIIRLLEEYGAEE